MTTATTQRQPELAGQIVVVIGGSAGIGLETPRRARAEVILTGRNPDRLERATTELGARSSAASSTRRCPRRCSATTSTSAVTSSARRSPSGAWWGRPTSPPSPCTS